MRDSGLMLATLPANRSNQCQTQSETTKRLVGGKTFPCATRESVKLRVASIQLCSLWRMDRLVSYSWIPSRTCATSPKLACQNPCGKSVTTSGGKAESSHNRFLKRRDGRRGALNSNLPPGLSIAK